MLVIGLISGTSVDGIDAALVNISGSTIDLTAKLLAGATYPYPTALREHILAVCGGAPLSIEALAALDDAIAHQFAQAAIAIQAGHPTATLIGSHGQTVYHRPPERESGIGSRESGESALPLHSSLLTPYSLGYSLQLGRGAAIAHTAGITTVSNFRAADIAAGGHGAPLVPAVDVALLSHPTASRCVQNIGGIGNVAYLPARKREPAVSAQPSAISHQPSELKTPFGLSSGRTQNSKLSPLLRLPLLFPTPHPLLFSPHASRTRTAPTPQTTLALSGAQVCL